jgi:hypothetical protein
MLTQTMMPNHSGDFDTQKIFAAINQASSIHDLQKIVKDPRPAICVVEQHNSYNMVLIKGKVVEHTILTLMNI